MQKTLSQALKPFIAEFLARAKGTDLKQVPPGDELKSESARLGLRFETSFGKGNFARIVWLACFAPGQRASLDGVYPVLLYHLDQDRLSVAYGVSATAEAAAGEWPRRWPIETTAGLKHFAERRYGASFVLKEFASPSAAALDGIADSFVQVINDFTALRRAMPKSTVIDGQFSNRFAEATTAAGMVLGAQLPRRFIAAMASKQLCILTGLAGSGKTKLAEAMALWLSASPAQFKLVAVGADWTNNEPLLGYADALHGNLYRKPANGALDLMLQAATNPALPHFLVLDEMNLSHVERYFADVLSAIESSSAPLALHGHTGPLPSEPGRTADVPPRLPLPRNLFIIGTVNVDETTYTFSPKVLDRANVIEFRASRDQLDAFLDDPARLNLAALQDAQGSGLGASFGPALVATVMAEHDTTRLGADQAAFKAALLQAFDLLAEMGAEFGFRSALEMVRFAVIHKAISGDTWQWTDALDAQVLQKLLPRLHGSARKLDPVLTALHGFCTQHGLGDSLEKIERMQKRLQADGFASFAEN